MPNPVVALRIPPDLHERVKQEAARQGTTPSELMRNVIADSFPPEPQVGPAMLNPRTRLRPRPR